MYWTITASLRGWRVRGGRRARSRHPYPTAAVSVIYSILTGAWSAAVTDPPRAPGWEPPPLLGAGGGASGWLWTPLLARRGLVVLGTGKSGGGGGGAADQVAGLSGEVSDPPPLYVLCAPRLL